MNKSVVWWVETQMDTGVDMKVPTVQIFLYFKIFELCLYTR